MKLTELAEKLGLARPDREVEITGVAPLQEAGATDLSFISERKWLERVLAGEHGAAAFLVPLEWASELPYPHLVTPTPALHVAQAAIWLGGKTLTVKGIHPTACIDPTAKLGPGVAIGPHVVIEAEVEIGADTVLYAGVVIHARCTLGARCSVGSNSVIGSDGFGYEFTEGKHQKIPHLGTVQIGDEVEIGAATTIDRGRFGATRIGTGTKIDNLVQIAHNVEIGRHCLIVSQVGIAGSCRIEDGVVLAGQAGLVPHVTIGRGTRVGAATGVTGSVPAGVTWSGYWGQPHRDNLAQLAAVRSLPAFIKKVQAFIKKWEEAGR